MKVFSEFIDVNNIFEQKTVANVSVPAKVVLINDFSRWRGRQQGL
jgi:hypothetical protein